MYRYLMLTVGILLPNLISSCSVNQVEECNKLLKTALAHPPKTFQAIGEPYFSTICGEIDQYKVCVSKFYATCDIATKMVIDGMLDGMYYMCHDGKETYLKHHQCLGGEELNVKGKRCVDALTATSKRITSRFQYAVSVTESEKNQALDDLCSATKDFETCVKRVVTEHCGEEAAEFEVEVVSRSVKPAEALGGCSPTSFRHMKWVIIGCSFVGLVILAVIIRLVIRRVRKPRPTGGDFNNPLEGAYSSSTKPI